MSRWFWPALSLWLIVWYILFMKNNRETALRTALEECFWGDYAVSLEQALEKLGEHDAAFEKLLVARIITDSSFPSALLGALFSEDELRRLLDNVTLTGRAERRRTLARAVLFHERWEAEPSWIRA